MASQRDLLFPSTSIGRTQGTRLVRTPSHESLTAHPLLSPSNSGPASPESSVSGTTNGAPRYVPYTPRQRAPPTAATTGTTLTLPSVAASSQQHQGDATSKLQLMNLKAAAQNGGLDTGSMGWAILEKLVLENDQWAEWTEIWSALTSGKATLFLPLEHSNEKITPDLVRDHVIFCDGPSTKDSPIVTLSGLRGVLNNEKLILRSSLHTSSKTFQDLHIPSLRSATLATLPPLPISPTSSIPSPYPTFALPSHIPSLPLPPRPQPSIKPALPPRPSLRSASIAQPAASRLSNPFASLFGHKSPTPSATSSPTTTTTAQSLLLHHALDTPTSSPASSIHTLDSADHVVSIAAFTISRRISSKSLSREINKVLRAQVKEGLMGCTQGMPGWVVDRVHDFTGIFYPFVRAPRKDAKARREAAGEQGGGGISSSSYVVNAFEEPPEEVAEMVQEFYALLEQDLRAGGTPFLGRRREEKERERDREKNAGEGDEKKVQEKAASEGKIKEIMEVVEATICDLFYDRLFMQPMSDDLSHDEALSSRIAALNMLDLGLEHLDISVGSTRPDVDLVVKACGQMLTQLDTSRAPAMKGGILVAAHKIIVDGLSRLPPVHLMSEEEKDAQSASLPAREALPNNTSTTVDSPLPLETPLTTPSTGIPPTPPPKPEQAPSSTSSPSTVPTILEPEPETSSVSETLISSSPNSPKHVPPPLPLSSSPPSSSHTPLLTVSPPPQKEATPVSGDVLFPLIIFSVVKSNPPQLVSNLLFIQRFRNRSVGGEEGYCLINLMAVAEFLENVDLAALGLGDSDKVLSTADLTPIPINRSPAASEASFSQTQEGISGSFRGRVEQQVDAITGSANKVLTGVVDSSFGMLRSLLPNSPYPQTPEADPLQGSAPWNSVRPGFGLLRRESGFSIAGIAAALPGVGRIGSTAGGEESGQQLVTVSRAGSVRSRISGRKVVVDEEDEESESESESGDEDEDDENEDDDEDDENDGVKGGDARSIRSFESMMSRSNRRKKETSTRKSLSDRLALMSGRAHQKSPPSKQASLLPHAQSNRFDTPGSSRPASPVGVRIAPPNKRFIECTAGDLKISEVSELLQDYRRLVEGIRTMGGFEE